MAASNHIKRKKYNTITVAHNHSKGECAAVNTTNKALKLRIEELLKEKNMTRYRLAMNSGITHSTLKNILHETVSDSLLSTVILIASGFNITVIEFLDSPLFCEDKPDI